uniref:MBD domain-containing protein n=1 Tax=Calcidiscus leptoporus TaxID=127549 RepID=A0A7S0JA62_9EUKA|mmetsp:Transcript_47507/g.110182  ORF Transcript_47507/g.110182 Transcript_47507/m.110182 type:complete len:384 (+) Transcript_47507:183-1334(+)
MLHSTATAATDRPRRLCGIGLGKTDRRTVRVGQHFQAVGLPDVVMREAYRPRCEGELAMIHLVEREAARAVARKLTKAAFTPPARERTSDFDSDGEEALMALVEAGELRDPGRSSYVTRELRDPASQSHTNGMMLLAGAVSSTLAAAQAHTAPSQSPSMQYGGSGSTGRVNRKLHQIPGHESETCKAHARKQLEALGDFLKKHGGAVDWIEGWQARTESRKFGSKASDTYFYAPSGQRFRSRAEVARAHFNLHVPQRSGPRAEEPVALSGASVHEAAGHSGPPSKRGGATHARATKARRHRVPQAPQLAPPSSATECTARLPREAPHLLMMTLTLPLVGQPAENAPTQAQLDASDDRKLLPTPPLENVSLSGRKRKALHKHSA